MTHKFRLIRLIFSIAILASCFTLQAYTVSPSCPDFTNLNADYVEAYTGNTRNPFNTQGIVDNRHTLITTQGTDPNTGGALALLPPGENQVIRLGNDRIGAEAEALTYHFTVDKNNPVLLLKFAVVLEDPQHSSIQQPRFVVRITDKDGNLIEECAEYDVSARDGIPGFQTYNRSYYSPVRWRDWTNVGLDMSPFIGKEVQVQFITYDCTLTAHFGYAYFTASCIPNSLQLEACTGMDFTMEAPKDFESYLWDNGDTTRTSTRTAGENNSSHSCLVTSATGCQFTLNAYVTSNPVSQITVIKDTVCEGEPYTKNYFDLPAQYNIGTSTYYNAILNTETCSTSQITELQLTVIQRYTHIKAAICGGENYIENGFNIINPAAGVRRDSLFLQSKNGKCDSIICLELVVSPSLSIPNIIAGDASICTDEPATYSFAGAELLTEFSWNIPENAKVVGKDNQPQITLYFIDDTPVTLSLSGENGCGSGTVSLDIHPRQTYAILHSDTICAGTEYNKHGFNLGVQNEIGYFAHTHDFKTTLGCDSSVTLALTVFPAFVPQIVGDTLSCNPGGEITLLAMERDMALTLNPEMLKDSTFSYAYDCDIAYSWNTGDTGSSITVTPDAATLYSVTATNSTGCSATAQQWVMVKTNTPQVINETICHGESYTKYGLNVDEAGVYPVSIAGENCTVPVTVDLSVLPVYDVLINDPVLCYGMPYNEHGLNVTPYESGTVSQTFYYQTAAGCDSTVTIQMYVLPEKEATVRDTICQNSSYAKNGFTLPEQYIPELQTYTKTVTTEQGCDSTVTLQLFVNPVYTNIISDEVNAGETYEKYGFKFPNVTADLTETKQLKGTCGCDSVVTLNLKVKEPPHPFEYPDNISDADCFTEPPVMDFSIKLLLSSPPEDGVSALMNPVVGDIDSDGEVEILVMNNIHTSNLSHYTAIYIYGIDETTNSLYRKYTVNIPPSNPSSGSASYMFSFSPIAIAKTDGDLYASIYYTSTIENKLYKYVFNGTSWAQQWSVQYTDNSTYSVISPAVTDIMGNGRTQVVILDKIIDTKSGIILADGGLIPASGRSATYSFGCFGHRSPANRASSFESSPAVADIDGDGIMDVIGGDCVYGVNLVDFDNAATGNTFSLKMRADNTDHPEIGDGGTAIADIDNCGQLEVVVAGPVANGFTTASKGMLFVYNPRTGDILHTNQITDFGRSLNIAGPSRPFAGDFDNDGYPEIALNGVSTLYSFKYNMDARTLDNTWTLPTTDLSGATSLTAFDFAHDGKNRLVYRDEQQLRIIDASGSTPVVEASFDKTASATLNEYPVIADINGDGAAEIIVTAGNIYGHRGELRIYASGNKPWAPARPVWNQSSYYALNVNKDLTIPQRPISPATVFPGKDGVLGTADDVRPFNGFLMQQTVLNQNGNRLWLASNIVWDTEPAATVTGNSATFTGCIKNIGNAGLQPPVYVTFYKNDTAAENIIALDSIQRPLAVGDTLCFSFTLTDLKKHAPANKIWISVNDRSGSYPYQTQCMTDGRREIEMTLPDDTTRIDICQGDSTLFGNRYYSETGIYSDTLKTVLGEDSIVSLKLKVNPVYNDSPVAATICPGDYIFFGKNYYRETGIYTDTLKTVSGCDSIVTLDLTVKSTPSMAITEKTVCQDDTVHLTFTGIAPFELDYAFNGTRQNITVSGMDTALAATQPGKNLFVMYELISGEGCSSSGVSEKGVDINGVIWATRNVDKPGTFTGTPEDAGWFYQWGKKTGWSTTDPMVNSNGGTDWDWSLPANTGKWEAENDPCPCGWRVPTKEEQWDMIGEGSVDTVQNGVRGRLSRTDRNTVFLPYATVADGRITGWRNEDGSLYVFETDDYSNGPHHSDYWSGTQENGSEAWNLCFRTGFPLQEPIGKRFAPLLRCVKDLMRCPQTDTITVNSMTSDTIKAAICSNDSFPFNGKYYNQTGVYTEVLKTASGCDSIITLDLKVNPVYNDSPVTAAICQGESIFFGNKYYKQAGTYIDTLKTVFNCDSIVTLNLTVKPAPAITVAENAVCQNGTVHLTFTGVAPFELDYTFNGTRQKAEITGTDMALAATQAGENRLIVHNLTAGNGCSLTGGNPAGGIEINGVIWATRNVDAPGTFAANPESAGMFYQWNSTVGWSLTDPLTSTDGSSWNNPWDGNGATTWEITNNVCPAGFRVPTYAELQSLADADNRQATINGVRGRLFGSGNDTIFLPVYGYIGGLDGLLYHTDVSYYWSSTALDISETEVHALISGGDIGWYSGYRGSGFNVRCVADITQEPEITYPITVYPIKSNTVNSTICSTDSVLFNGKYYNQAGTYSDTLQAVSGCDSIVTLHLTVQDPSRITITPDNQYICQDGEQEISLTAKVESGNPAEIMWYDDDKTPVQADGTSLKNNVTPLENESTYWAYAIDPVCGNSQYAYTTVYLTNKVYLWLKADSSRMQMGSDVTLTVTPSNNEHSAYRWYDAITGKLLGETSGNTFTLTLDTPGDYVFYVSTDNGYCPDAKSEDEKVSVADFTIIPNIITPYNHNRQNDSFMTPKDGKPGYKVEIYNRYQQTVFEGENGWDGTYRGRLAEPGTYYFRLFMKDGRIEIGTIEVAKF